MGEDSRDRLQRYFDDELDAAERTRFEAEMTDDDRVRLAALGEMRLLLNNALDSDVDIWSGVAKKLDKQKAQRGWLRRRSSIGAASSILLAAAATLIFFIHPWNVSRSDNDCDVENMEVDNGYATVMQVHDIPREGDGATTIIWAEED